MKIFKKLNCLLKVKIARICIKFTHLSIDFTYSYMLEKKLYEKLKKMYSRRRTSCPTEIESGKDLDNFFCEDCTNCLRSLFH